MNEFLHHAFVEPLQQGFFLKALLGGCMVAVVCGVMGCLVVLRRMAFLGDALSHSMVAGVAAGYLIMKLVFNREADAQGMLLGSLFAAILTVALIGFISKVSRIKDDSAIGIMYCGVFSAGAVMISLFSKYIHVDLVHFILGDILGVADRDLWVAAIAGAFVLSLIFLFFRHFQIATFDPVMAASLGFPVLLIDYLLTTCVSLVVVSAISMVGVILVVGLLITPAATAYLLTDRLKRMMILAAFFGITSVVGGLYLCVWINSSGGSAVMVFCTFQFLVVLTLAPRYGLLAGWLRKRRMVPQDLIEDILRSVLKSKDAVPLEKLAQFVKVPAAKFNRAIQSMTRDGLLLVNGSGAALTDAGRERARLVMRAHRIWETYLQSVGMPESEIDRKAHKLEHILDDDAIDYLDDKLGHPLQDPHGSEIPQDFIHIESGQPVMLSLMREGQRAEVVRVTRKAGDVKLKAGDQIRMGSRKDDGKSWVVHCDGREDLVLDHDAADGVFVQMISESKA
jgi:manganese/iron transport system permease protein/iron/zinc/copper transport system permease protein